MRSVLVEHVKMMRNDFLRISLLVFDRSILSSYATEEYTVVYISEKNVISPLLSVFL